MGEIKAKLEENIPENKSYARLAKYYDLIHSDKDYKKEVEFIEYVFDTISKKKVTSILDVACGTGSHAEYLKKSMFVMGIDSAKSMLEIAKRKVKDVDFFREDMRDFKLDRTFDAVVCLNDSFSYNLDDESMLDTLKCFANHLENEGIVLFDVIAVQPQEQVLINTFVNDDLEVARISKWKPLDETALVEYVYMVKQKDKMDFNVDHHEYRVTKIKHIKRLMKKAGFRGILMLDGFTNKRYRKGSTRAVLVGKLKK